MTDRYYQENPFITEEKQLLKEYFHVNEEEQVIFRCMTLNINDFKSTMESTSIKEVLIEALLDIRPQLVAFQQCSDKEELVDIAKALSMNYTYEPTGSLALLSTFVMTKVRHFEANNFRTMLQASVRLKGIDKDIMVATTLTKPTESDVQALQTMCKKLLGKPYVLPKIGQPLEQSTLTPETLPYLVLGDFSTMRLEDYPFEELSRLSRSLSNSAHFEKDRFEAYHYLTTAYRLTDAMLHQRSPSDQFITNPTTHTRDDYAFLSPNFPFRIATVHPLHLSTTMTKYALIVDMIIN
mmetsp:Transcript_1990/g.2861  ORF Transcript_1990/g.2861 Transcript_1990/m.2861 type:complete len:295 (+) Transcript_1990:51-935(+)